jgi:hypothetical protein
MCGGNISNKRNGPTAYTELHVGFSFPLYFFSFLILIPCTSRHIRISRWKISRNSYSRGKRQSRLEFITRLRLSTALCACTIVIRARVHKLPCFYFSPRLRPSPRLRSRTNAMGFMRKAFPSLSSNPRAQDIRLMYPK